MLRGIERYLKNHISEEDQKKQFRLRAPYQEEIDSVLEQLKALKNLQEKDKPLVSYFYLYEKADIFLNDLATPKEIEAFLHIFRNLSDHHIPQIPKMDDMYDRM